MLLCLHPGVGCSATQRCALVLASLDQSVSVNVSNHEFHHPAASSEGCVSASSIHSLLSRSWEVTRYEPVYGAILVHTLEYSLAEML